MTLEECHVLSEMISQFQDLGTFASTSMMDADMDTNMMDAAIPASLGGETTKVAVGKSADIDMTDIEQSCTMASSNTKRKRVRAGGKGATKTATSSCARHRGKRVCFHPIVSVGCAPSGVDRTCIRKRTPVTREEHWAFVCAQLHARMLQTTAAVMH